MRTILLAGLFLTLLAAADTGIAPRAAPADYQAHASVKTAVLAAALVPSDQVKKMFSGEIAKEYIVIEVAVYPADSRSLNVDRLDFELETEDQVLRASNPSDISNPWLDAGVPGAPIPSRAPNITGESGIIVSRGTDPATGHPTNSVGTYQGVAVSNYPPPNDPAPPPVTRRSQSAAAQKVRDLGLPEGASANPVAGYVYFRHRGKKHAPLTLNYTNDDSSVDLKLPK